MPVIYIPIIQVMCQKARDRKRMLYKRNGALLMQNAAQPTAVKVQEDDNKRFAAIAGTDIFRKQAAVAGEPETASRHLQ
jgi:hypothetical protein